MSCSGAVAEERSGAVLGRAGWRSEATRVEWPGRRSGSDQR